MKTRNGIEGSHRGKGPLKRPRGVPKQDSSESDTGSNSDTDQDGDPDVIIDDKLSTPKQKCKRIRKASPHSDDLPDLESSDPESQPRIPRNRQVNRSRSPAKKRKNQIESSDSDTEAYSPDEEAQRTPSTCGNNHPAKQRRSTTKKKCQRPNQIEESSDSDTEPAIPDSPGDSKEESPSSPRNEQVMQSAKKKRPNQIEESSNSDTELDQPDSPGDVSSPEDPQRVPHDSVKNQNVRQKRRKKRKCQRQEQIESSDSDAEPESPGSASGPEEPQSIQRNRLNNQLPQPRKSARIRTRRPFHKPTRQDVFDGIEENAGRPRKSAITQRAANFTRESHYRNRDNLSASETSSVDEVVDGKYWEMVGSEEEEREDREEESQEHDYRRQNLASQQRRWDAEREQDERRRDALVRRHQRTTFESPASSGDEDLQPLPQEAYRPNDDEIPWHPVVNAPPAPVPNLPAVPIPVQQAPVVCPYNDEDDSIYGVEDAQVNRLMENRGNHTVSAGVIETDEELEALMLAMDERAPVDPRDMVEGRRVLPDNVDQQMSDDDGSIIIFSDSEEEDLSIPIQILNRYVQDDQVAGPSRSAIDKMLAVPSCYQDNSGPVQPILNSSHPEPQRSDIDEMLAVPSCSEEDSPPVEPIMSHPELQNRGQVIGHMYPVEDGSFQNDEQEMFGSHLYAEKALQVLEVDNEERLAESSHGIAPVTEVVAHCSKDDGKIEEAISEDNVVSSNGLNTGPIIVVVGRDVYVNGHLQNKALPESPNENRQDYQVAVSAYPDRVPMEVQEETEGGRENASTAASVSRRKPFDRCYFVITEDEKATGISLQQKKNTGDVSLERISSQSAYISESLESEERNLGENGESEDTDDGDGTGHALEALSEEITPVRRKSFKLIVSDSEEEEEPAASNEPDYSIPPIADTEDETGDDSTEGSASSHHNSDTENDEEKGTRSRSGSEDEVTSGPSDSENDKDRDRRRRSKRAQQVSPQKRQYQENMERYKLLRERKKSK